MKKVLILTMALALGGCGETYVPAGHVLWDLIVQMWAVPNVEEYDANHKTRETYATYEGCVSASTKVRSSNNAPDRINIVCVPRVSGGGTPTKHAIGWQ